MGKSINFTYSSTLHKAIKEKVNISNFHNYFQNLIIIYQNVKQYVQF